MKGREILTGLVLVCLCLSAPKAAGSQPGSDDVFPDLKGVETPALLKMLADTRPSRRATAAAELGARRAAGAGQALLPLLSDISDFVRLKAAAGLMDLGEESGRSVLHDLVLRSPLSLDAAAELAGREDQLGRAMMMVALESRYAGRRRIALQALGRSIDEAVARAALAAGAKDDDCLTRETAIGLLEQRRAPWAVALLAQLLRDPVVVVRWRATAGLARTGLPEAVPKLIEALTDADDLVRRSAAVNLSILTGRSANADGTATGDGARELQQEWRSWWDANKGQFPPGRKMEGKNTPQPKKP